MFKFPAGAVVESVDVRAGARVAPAPPALRKKLTLKLRRQITEDATAYMKDQRNGALFRKYRAHAYVLQVSLYALDSVFGFRDGRFHATRDAFKLTPLPPARYTPAQLRAAWGTQKPLRIDRRVNRVLAARVNACSVEVTLPDGQKLRFRVDSDAAAARVHRVLRALI